MWQVVGHQWATTLLQNSLTRGNISHAYLFTGPPHIGKTTLALNLAQALNCTGEDKPCGECLSCQKIAQGIHPDVRMVDLAYQEGLLEGREGSTALGIDAIRSIQSDAALKPFEGRWKVFIIPQAENMTPGAANCLLKTLEEPPLHVVLLLTALHTDLLFPTIVSRCQIFNLRPPSIDLIREALEGGWGLEGERAHLIAALSAGRMGWAVEAAQNEALLKERNARLDELLSLSGARRLERLSFAQRWGSQPERAKEILTLWLGWWRDLLLAKEGCWDKMENIDRRNTLVEEAEKHELGEIKEFISSIRKALQQLESNVNLRLALEVLMLDLPSKR
ncbi:MAG: DNA polymerase III subunit delta' [Anaerolineae bacterium]